MEFECCVASIWVFTPIEIFSIRFSLSRSYSLSLILATPCEAWKTLLREKEKHWKKGSRQHLGLKLHSNKAWIVIASINILKHHFDNGSFLHSFILHNKTTHTYIRRFNQIQAALFIFTAKTNGEEKRKTFFIMISTW